MQKKLAILVSEKYSAASPFTDDLLLSNRLMEEDIACDIVVWDNSTVDMRKYDAAIIRSCWDYDSRVKEFLNRLQVINQQCLLLNPLHMVLENSDKLYLNALENKGVRIVPTMFIKSETFSLPSSWEEVVIKPTISASGKDTYRYKARELEGIFDACRSIQEKEKIPMVQKFISSVTDLGEYSSVVIDGRITFTMNKIPKSGEFLVHKHFGGIYTRVEPNAMQLDFLHSLMSVLDEQPLYMRIDYLRDANGEYCLLELEQIEPYIYLAENPKGLELLVNGIKKRL